MPVINQQNSNQFANTYTLQEIYVLCVFRYLLVVATLEDEHFAEVPPNTLKDLIKKSQCSNSMAEEACLAL